MAKKAKTKTRFDAKRKGGGKPKAVKKAARKPGPRSQALPGMAQVRSKRLDHLCESLNEHRTDKATATAGESEDLSAALAVMQQEKRNVYRHAGIEFARMPGAEKIRARKTKEEGDADESDLENGGPVDDEPIHGDDPGVHITSFDEDGE